MEKITVSVVENGPDELTEMGLDVMQAGNAREAIDIFQGGF